MSKRRRETEVVDKSGKLNETDIEEKRAKASSDAGEGKDSNEVTTAGSPSSEESRPHRSKGQQKKNENLSDVEERRELRSQKSLDGDDSASEKGSVMEETNSHLYQDLLDAVLKMKDNNGRMICELFLKFPPRQKAVESKNMQNQDMEDVLLLTKKNRHNALIAQGVNCMVIQERESGAMDILKHKIKKKKEKLHDSLKHRLANDAKKLTEKIKAINGEIKTSNKTYEKASEKLVNLKQQILNVQGDLDSARISYSTLEQKYAEFRKIDEGDDGCSLTSMPSIS